MHKSVCRQAAGHGACNSISTGAHCSCHSGVYLRLVVLTPLYFLQMPAANDIH